MDDLSLLLASKDVFLSLSTQKVKTLKQAQQLPNQNNNHKLLKVAKDYEDIFQKVRSSINNQQNDVNSDTDSVSKYEEDPLLYYLSYPSIIQIVGGKGGGKTALALRLVFIFSESYKQKSIKILNCSGGITINRFTKFIKIPHDYYDIFSIDDLIQILSKAKKDANPGILIMDGCANLLMGSDRQKSGLSDVLINLNKLGWCIVFTNFTQGKFQVQEQEVLNVAAYYPHIFGSLAHCRLSIEQQSAEDCSFRIRLLKTIDDRNYEYLGLMNSSGIYKLTLIQNI